MVLNELVPSTQRVAQRQPPLFVPTGFPEMWFTNQHFSSATKPVNRVSEWGNEKTHLNQRETAFTQELCKHFICLFWPDCIRNKKTTPLLDGIVLWCPWQILKHFQVCEHTERKLLLIILSFGSAVCSFYGSSLNKHPTGRWYQDLLMSPVAKMNLFMRTDI